jgi:hypothetical protein
VPRTIVRHTKTRTRTFGSIVRLNDPDFDLRRRKQLVYEFEDRKFYENPLVSGLYAGMAGVIGVPIAGSFDASFDDGSFS